MFHKCPKSRTKHHYWTGNECFGWAGPEENSINYTLAYQLRAVRGYLCKWLPYPSVLNDGGCLDLSMILNHLPLNYSLLSRPIVRSIKVSVPVIWIMVWSYLGHHVKREFIMLVSGTNIGDRFLYILLLYWVNYDIPAWHFTEWLKLI